METRAGPSASPPLVTTDAPLLMVGAGPVDPGLLRRLAPGRMLVAADGGADHALAAGLLPDLVLGDMDSLADAAALAGRTRLVPLADQNSTDLEKALFHISAPAIIALGFLGGRLDHTLAALHAVIACRRASMILMVGMSDLMLRVRGAFSARLPVGMRLSVWPLGRQHFTASAGLRYPLTGLTLAAGERIGTSNETDAPEVRIEAPAKGPGYLIIAPLDALPDFLPLLT